MAAQQPTAKSRACSSARMQAASQRRGARYVRARARAPVRHAEPSVAQAPSIQAFPEEAGLPIIGKAAWMLKTIGTLDQLHPLFEKHGSDTFWINRGPMGGWALATRDRDMITGVLSDDENILPSWPPSLLRLAQGGDKPRDHQANTRWRRIVGTVLRTDTLARLHIPAMITAFERRLDAAVVAGEPVLWASMGRQMAFEEAMRCTTGDLMSASDMERWYSEFNTYLAGAFTPDYKQTAGLPRTPYRRSWDARQRIIAGFEQRLQGALQSYRAGELHSPLVGELFAAYEEDHERLEDGAGVRQVAAECVEILFTGTGTTAYAFSTLATLLCEHGEWLGRARAEQERIVEEFGPKITPKVLSRSYVAQALVHEVLRVKPVIGAQFRRAVRDTVLPDGMHVPAGTAFWLHTRQRIIDNSTRAGRTAFDPAQWLTFPRGGDLASEAPTGFNPALAQHESLAFGHGARRCLGRHLGTMELIAVVAVLARRVAEVRMSDEEMQRPFFPMFEHPTGMPVTLVPK